MMRLAALRNKKLALVSIKKSKKRNKNVDKKSFESRLEPAFKTKILL